MHDKGKIVAGIVIFLVLVLFPVWFTLASGSFETPDLGDVKKLTRWYFAALARGDLAGVTDLMTHRVPFDRIDEGYRLLADEPEDVLKVLVTYG